MRRFFGYWSVPTSWCLWMMMAVTGCWKGCQRLAGRETKSEPPTKTASLAFVLGFRLGWETFLNDSALQTIREMTQEFDTTAEWLLCYRALTGRSTEGWITRFPKCMFWHDVRSNGVSVYLRIIKNNEVWRDWVSERCNNSNRSLKSPSVPHPFLYGPKSNTRLVRDAKTLTGAHLGIYICPSTQSIHFLIYVHSWTSTSDHLYPPHCSSRLNAFVPLP